MKSKPITWFQTHLHVNEKKTMMKKIKDIKLKNIKSK